MQKVASQFLINMPNRTEDHAVDPAEGLDPRDYDLDAIRIDAYNNNYGGDPEPYRFTEILLRNVINGNLENARSMYRELGLTLVELDEVSQGRVSIRELAKDLRV